MTAIEFLVNQLEQNKFITESQIHIAKEMEKQQQDELAIDFIKWTISQEAEDLIYDLKIVGEVGEFPSTEEVFKLYKRFKNK